MTTFYRRQSLLVAAIIFVCASATYAQSGRRSSGGTTTTTPSVSGPKAIEKKPEKPPRLQLLVGIASREPFTNVPYYISDTVIAECVHRLGDAADVIVTAATGPMDRSGAVQAAKAETTRYVVWLQIGSELADSGKQPSKNSVDELYVSYMVLEPATAKIKRSGRSHHQIYQTGRGGVSTTNKNSPLYSEYALKQAARETAERVLEAFDIKLRAER